MKYDSSLRPGKVDPLFTALPPLDSERIFWQKYNFIKYSNKNKN